MPKKYYGAGVGYSKPVQVSSEEVLEDKVPSVLFITTHGSYEDSDLKEKKISVPMNIKKINAVTMGICNFLNADTANDIASQINKAIREGKEIIDMDAGSEFIKTICMENDPEIEYNTKYKSKSKSKSRKIVINDQVDDEDDTEKKYIKNRSDFLTQINKAYRIKEIKNGQEMYNKTFSVVPNERAKDKTPFFNTITLLPSHNDLLQQELGRTYHKDEQLITLEDILKKLSSSSYGIKNLIIVDLTCSETDSLTARGARYFEKNHVGGGYSLKTKKHKRKHYRNKNTTKKTTKKNKGKKNYRNKKTYIKRASKRGRKI
jgi:hypothetical protein